MSSIAEALKLEMLARLQAAPEMYDADPPVLVTEIRRSHLTAVDRDRAPAIYLRAGDMERLDLERTCPWKWSMAWRVSVYVRSDEADAAADPLVVEVVRRLNPTLGTPYTNGVDLRLHRIEVETEVADTDAQRVDVVGIARFQTVDWALDEAMR
jgi:hypothetical protein